MTQDLLTTITALQTMAIGNCRKRIEEAAAKTKRVIGPGQYGDRTGRSREKSSDGGGITSILKEKHGL